MTLQKATVLASTQLKKRKIQTAYLDSVVLLAHLMGITKEEVFSSYFDCIPEKIFRSYRELINRRSLGEPVAYLCGKKEFYGRSFQVNQSVLIPRPETECLVDAALKYGDKINFGGKGIKVHDVGTGSGAVAITLQLERPYWDVSASDISLSALTVAKENRNHFNVARIPMARSDLLPYSPRQWSLIVSNPPYLTTEEVFELKKKQCFEPSIALDGGYDGTNITFNLMKQAKNRLVSRGSLIIEIASERFETIIKYAETLNYVSTKLICDLAGMPRIVIASI